MKNNQSAQLNTLNTYLASNVAWLILIIALFVFIYFSSGGLANLLLESIF